MREQSSALSFGTAIHDAVLVMEQAQDLTVGLDRFKQVWTELQIPDGENIAYDYLMPRNSHHGYLEKGLRVLQDWWALIMWESDKVIAREYQFTVDIGSNQLTGTIDKLAFRQTKFGEWLLLVSDYKTSMKQPTRDYLQHDIQFHSYCYATTRPEFWTGIQNGAHLFAASQEWRRSGEWVQLVATKRIDAGFRDQMHYNRLAYAIDQIEKSQALGIYVPNISGESCEFCSYRRTCGLPSREDEGLLTPGEYL